MFACLYRPPAPRSETPRSETRSETRSERRSEKGSERRPEAAEAAGRRIPGAAPTSSLLALACDFSPRCECHHGDLVSLDIGGLGRLFPTTRAIGEALRREAAVRGFHVHVAIAGTRTAALVLAQVRPGLTIVERDQEAEALAPMSLSMLAKIAECFQLIPPHTSGKATGARAQEVPDDFPIFSAFRAWGLKTLGDLAALPSADLAARLGQEGGFWQAIARGEDRCPLVPSVPEERFEASLDLDWPIDDLEPLSFVLTRLLEPISAHLERRDRGAAVLRVILRLVSREIYERRLQLPSPLRDVRTLRTLALLDLESHPPASAIDRVTIAVDPTPGRVLQHTLFTRAVPTPEQLSTLLARLGALMGQDRVGAPAAVDSYCPGAFDLVPFRTEHSAVCPVPEAAHKATSATSAGPSTPSTAPGTRHLAQHVAPSTQYLAPVVSALRRCRQPVPVRVVVDGGRPVRVASDRQGFIGGPVITAAGPWRTSGAWWAGDSWNRDEWDVALHDGAVYRIFRDHGTNGWFIEAVVD